MWNHTCVPWYSKWSTWISSGCILPGGCGGLKKVKRNTLHHGTTWPWTFIDVWVSHLASSAPDRKVCVHGYACVCACVCGQHRMSRNHSWSFHEIPTPHNHQTHSINSFCSHSSSTFIAYVYSATFNCAHSLQITHGYRSVNDNGKCGRHLRCFKAH